MKLVILDRDGTLNFPSGKVEGGFVEMECPATACGKILFQADADAAKRDFFPRDVFFSEKCCFKAFDARRELGFCQPGPVKEMNLIDVRQVDERKKRVDVDACTGFFKSFAERRVRRRFAVFHESGRERP